MRRILVILLVVSLFAAACAAIVGFPDVPSVGVDGGVHPESGIKPPSHDARADTKSHPKKGGDAGTDAPMRDARAPHDSRPDVPTPPPPSCAAGGSGLTNCGPEGGVSCCAALGVPGGIFYREYDPLGKDSGPELSPDGGPVETGAPAQVGGVQLDEFLVTVGRFRQFVTAWNGVPPVKDASADGKAKDAHVDAVTADARTVDAGPLGYRPRPGSGKHKELHMGLGLSGGGDAGTAPNDAAQNPSFEPGWLAADDALVDLPAVATCANTTWTDFAGTQENLPINCVNWYEAYAFCIWDGGFLPSEAEWELTAAGGSAQRLYPWGSTPPGTSSQYAIYDCNYPFPSGACNDTTIFRLAPVGTPLLGAGMWNQLDLAGEVAEWTFDWYSVTYRIPCSNCADLVPATNKVIRGGSYIEASQYLVPSNRESAAPQNRESTIGLRCARPLP